MPIKYLGQYSAPLQTRKVKTLLIKNEKGYEKSFVADLKAVKKGLKKARAEIGEPKKVPTSIALDPRFVSNLKTI